jgi:outer membrane protein assembly factor BamB
MKLAHSGLTGNCPKWVCLLWLGSALHLAAHDWPQYRGPGHDGVSTDRIVKQWTGAVTNPVWRAQFANGLSSIAVSGGKVFTQAKRSAGASDREFCLALNAVTGAELWATPLDEAIYDGGVGNDDGPRTTPSVEGDSAYVLTSYLKLYRLNVTNGAIIWQRDLRSLYGGDVIGWQNAASPLMGDGLIYVNANCGARSLMALRTSDGSEAWRAENEAMTHSTPVLADILGARQLIFATQSGLISLNPATGARFWKVPHPFSYSTSLGASPVVHQDMVFVSGAIVGYQMGAATFRVGFSNNVWTATQLWANTTTLASHWMTPVCRDGYLYGLFGANATYDSVRAQLKCVNLRTGAQQWSTNEFGRGGILLVDDRLLILTERGRLVLAQPNTNAYTQLASFQAIPAYHSDTNKCWNAPAVCDGRVYLRSTAQGACYDLSLPALKLDPPEWLAAQQLRLTVRTVTGGAIDSNRATSVRILESDDVTMPPSTWSVLANPLVPTNGTLRAGPVDTSGRTSRWFIVNEPN